MTAGRVGAFYFVDNRIVTNDIPVESGEEYGDFINYSAHWNLWTELTEKYPQYRNRDYAYYPRGRVVYNKEKEKFLLYVDPKIDKPGIISRVEECYELSKCMYEFAYDGHYRSIQPESAINEDVVSEDIVFDYELKWEL